MKAMGSEWEDLFEPVNLQLHKSEEHRGFGVALGTTLDGGNLRAELSSERFWRLEEGLTALLARRRCSGQLMEKAIGHCTFAALMSRPTLSVLNACYSFIQRH